MKESIVKAATIVLIVILTILYLSGCGYAGSTEHLEDGMQEDPFVAVYEGANYGVGYYRQTGVMYVVTQYGGFELLVDSDGKPLVYEESN